MVWPEYSKPNAEMPRFAAKKMFIPKVSKKGEGRTNLRSACPKARGLGYLWGKEARWSGMWGMMIGGKKKMMLALHRHVGVICFFMRHMSRGWWH